MKEIKLTRGKTALVNDEDYEFLSQFKWWAVVSGRTWWYAYTSDKYGKATPMQRMLIPGKIIIDHIDGNGLNNQRNNLRECTRAQNVWNSCRNKNNTSGYIGVRSRKGRNKWIARISMQHKEKYLGSFKGKHQAALRYDIEALKLHGEFAVTNFKLVSKEI